MQFRMHNPEGAIAEGYQFEESLNFCSRYLHDTTTLLNRGPRHDDNTGSSTEGQQYLRKIGRPLSGFVSSQLDFTSWTQAKRCVLMNYPNIEEYAQ